MPAPLVFVLGAVGAVALARLLLREARRVNAILHPEPPGTELAENGRRLRRDASGVYRPD